MCKARSVGRDRRCLRGNRRTVRRAELAARGINIVLVARRAEVLDELADSIRRDADAIDVRVVALDLTDGDATERLAQRTRDVDRAARLQRRC